MSSTVPPITPRSANTSRAASRMRWRVASRRNEPVRPAATGSSGATRCSGVGCRSMAAAMGWTRRRRAAGRLGSASGSGRRRGRLAARRRPARARRRTHARRRRGRAHPGRPVSRSLLAPHRLPPCRHRYIDVFDTLTYRIRLRILTTAAVVPQPLLRTLTTPGPCRALDPGGGHRCSSAWAPGPTASAS